MEIDPDDRCHLPRRLFAPAGRGLEHAVDAAGHGEAASLAHALMASLAGRLHACGQDAPLLDDAIAVMSGEAGR